MLTARELIKRSLALINVPGRGATISPEDYQSGFSALQEILDSSAVSIFNVPGINRHFFNLTAGKVNYSYGPGGDLDTLKYFGDPAPIGIESAYIREGAAITSNEKVLSPNFELAADWVLGAGWTIANKTAKIAPGNDGEAISQAAISVVAGVTYTVKLDTVMRAGSVTFTINQTIDLLDVLIDESGSFEFEVTPSTNDDITVAVTADALANMDFTLLTIVEKNKPLSSLSSSSTYDHSISPITQNRYNNLTSKNNFGRPNGFLFSRGYELDEIRFDSVPSSSHVLVLDVLINRLSITLLDSLVRINPEGIRWIRYELASALAGEYGQELSKSQIDIKLDAWDLMAASNERHSLLEMDPGLGNMRGSSCFNINGGD